jgi:hypothetical protein
MLYQVEIQPTKPVSSSEVFNLCANTGELVSFKVEDNLDNVKYHLEFREKADKTHVDRALEDIEKQGYSVDIKGIQRSPKKGEPEASKKSQSTASSEK